MNEIKIEKGIAIPEKNSHWRYSAAMHAMEVGDSFTQPDTVNFQVVAGQASKRLAPKKFISRKEGDNRRIWRIE